MLQRVDERHGYGTRVARGGLAFSSGDHRVVGYRVLMEWCSLSEEHRGMRWVLGFKRSLIFLTRYEAFACGMAGCRACGGGWRGWWRVAGGGMTAL